MYLKIRISGLNGVNFPADDHKDPINGARQIL